MNYLHTLTKLMSLLSAGAVLSTAVPPMPAFAGSQGEQCENGNYVGALTLQSYANGNFVIDDAGKLKATQDIRPTNKDEPGVFEIYNVSNLSGGSSGSYAIRSAQNPELWWRMNRRGNGSKKVVLENMECRANDRSMTFRIQRDGAIVSFLSKKNDRWIRVNNNGTLKANKSTTNRSTQFLAMLVDQQQPEDSGNLEGNENGEDNGNVEGNENGEDTTNNQNSLLEGWWRGNNSGYFQITETEASPGENNIEMVGYDNAGTLTSRFSGRTIGNVLVGSWQDDCANDTGESTLEITSDQLIRVAGIDTGNTRWERTNTPPTNLTEGCQKARQKVRLQKTVKMYVKQSMFAPGRSTTFSADRNASIKRSNPGQIRTISSIFRADDPTLKCYRKLLSRDWDVTTVDENGTARLTSIIEISKSNNSTCSNKTILQTKTAMNYMTVRAGEVDTKTRKIEIKDGPYKGSHIQIEYILDNANE